MYTAVTEEEQETVTFCGAWGFPEKSSIKVLTTDGGDNQHKTVLLEIRALKIWNSFFVNKNQANKELGTNYT